MFAFPLTERYGYKINMFPANTTAENCLCWEITLECNTSWLCTQTVWAAFWHA